MYYKRWVCCGVDKIIYIGLCSSSPHQWHHSDRCVLIIEPLLPSLSRTVWTISFRVATVVANRAMETFARLAGSDGIKSVHLVGAGYVRRG